MSDNVAITAGTGTNIATDDIGGVQHQRVKIEHGADGSATDVSSASPLPVVDAAVEALIGEVQASPTANTLLDRLKALLTELQAKADLTETQPVSASSLPLPSGAATSAKQDTLLTELQAKADLTETQPVSAASLPLPSGAATSANQSSANTLLTTISTAVSAATTDAITAKLATDKLQDGLTALTPKFAVVSASSSGDNTLVSAVTSKKIRVVGAMLVSAGTVSVKFQTAAAGNYLSGALPLVVNTGFVLPFNPVGWFETVAGDLLNLELSAAIAVGGCLTYIEV